MAITAFPLRRHQYFLCIIFLNLLLVDSSLIYQKQDDAEIDFKPFKSDDSSANHQSHLNSMSSLPNLTFSGHWMHSGEMDSADSQEESGSVLLKCYTKDIGAYINITIYDESEANVLAEFFMSPEDKNIQMHESENRIHVQSKFDKGLNLTEGCEFTDIELSFFNLLTGKGLSFANNETLHPAARDIGVQLHIYNSQCSLDLSTTVLTTQNQADSQLWPYTITMCVLALMQCVFCHRIQAFFMKNTISAMKTSPWTLVMLQTFDLCLAINNALSPFANLQIYLLVVVPYLLLSIYFDMKLIFETFIIHTAKYDPIERIKLLRSKCIESLIVITAICGISVTMLSELVLYSLACSLLPQIHHTYTTNKKARRYLWSLLSLFLPKILITAYIGFFQGNMLNQSLNLIVILTAAGLLLIQVFMLMIQSRFPRFVRNPQNPYRCCKLQDSSVPESTCSICLFSVREKPTGPQHPLLSAQQPDAEQSNSEIAVTICNHEFHEVCLKGWLSNKLTCPYCRKQLPPLVEEDII